MEMRLAKLHTKIDGIIKFLDPLLPLANCHMVEFLTERHYDNLLPTNVTNYLKNLTFEEFLSEFWLTADSPNAEHQTNELQTFIATARSHSLKVDNDICLSEKQLENKLLLLGGELKPRVRIKEFMSSKKSYEVETLSPLVAMLSNILNISHCIDIGGGRGNLPVVLSKMYNIPCLTIDCNKVALEGGMRRDRLITKQWRSIVKNPENESRELNVECGHNYECAYVTKFTDMCKLVSNKFSCDEDNMKLLLTGLHTCGDLGPDSLRIFTNNSKTSAIFNVPCCYHLLTESVDENTLCCSYEDRAESEAGFPMSQYLTGYQLGRNARMLASQSLERVVAKKELPSPTLLYRAVLQLLIKEHKCTHKSTEGKLKRLSKCQSFVQYFKMADSILNLQLSCQSDSCQVDSCINDSYAIDFYERHNNKDLIVFYLLRMCLAQVIESLILLDRLLFVYECGCMDSVLVKVFEAQMSPRCHALVAIRS